MASGQIYINPEPHGAVHHHPKASGFSPGQRCLMTFLWTIPIYVTMVLATGPKETWFVGVMGALILSLFSGVVALLIPTKNNLVFTCIGVCASLLLMAYIGASVNQTCRCNPSGYHVSGDSPSSPPVSPCAGP